MIFKICGFVSESANAISVEPVEAGLRISVPDAQGKLHTVVIQPEIVKELPDICSGHLGRDLGIQLVWDSERFNCRDAVSSVGDRKAIADISDSKFVVSFTETSCNVVICAPLRNAPSGDNVEFFEAPHSNAPRTWLGQHDPVIGQLVKRNRAKRNAVAKVKTLDSIAELEKQVDLLSQLVFALISQEQIPTWASQLKEVIDSHSSVRTPESAIADIGFQKESIRAIQELYFAARE